MPRVIALIQARMGSSRLPGKVLELVMGRPVLWYLVERLKHCHRVDEIAVATSSEPGDQPLVDFAAAHGLRCYAGSENDLVDRLYRAALEFNAGAIVRITGDCPLIDPAVTDNVIQKFLDAEGALDYASNCIPPRTYPVGLDVEVYAVAALARVWREISDPFHREWFPSNFNEHPEKYRGGAVYLYQDLSHLRWTLDYPADLEFIRAVFQRLYREGEAFLMAEVLALLEAYPELARINQAHVGEDGYQRALEKREGDSGNS